MPLSGDQSVYTKCVIQIILTAVLCNDISCDQDILDIWDALANVAQLLSALEIVSTCSLNSADIPRVQVLSELCQLQSSIRLDKLTVSIINGNTAQAEEILVKHLGEYEMVIRKRGAFSRVAHTAERLIYSQCQQLGFDAKAIESLLRTVQAKSIGRRAESLSDADGTPREGCIQEILRDVHIPHTYVAQSVAKIVVQNLSLSCCNLTYDRRVILDMDELLVTDRNLSPLIRMFGTKKELKAKSKATQHTSAKQIPTRGNQGDDFKDYGGIFLSYEVTDSRFKWGAGGGPLSALYSYSSIVDSGNLMHYGADLQVRALNVDFVVEPDEVLVLLEASTTFLVEMSSRLHSNEKNARIGLPTFRNNINDLRVTAECVHFVFAIKKQFLAEWSFRDVDVAKIRQQPSSPDANNDYSNNAESISFAADTVELHDLSPAGSLHPSTLSKTSSAISGPMLSGKIMLCDDSKPKLIYTITGAHICVLARFFDEVLDFMESARDRVSKVWTNICEMIAIQVVLPVERRGRQLIHSIGSDDDGEGDCSVRSTRESSSTFKVKSHHNFKPARVSVSKDGWGAGKWAWHIEMVDSVVVFPRNSASDDLVAVTFDHMSVVESSESDTWKPPGRRRMKSPHAYLYFDCALNEWKHGGGGDDEHDCSVSNDSLDTEVHSAEESECSEDSKSAESHGEFGQQGGGARQEATAMSRLFGYHNFDDDDSSCSESECGPIQATGGFTMPFSATRHDVITEESHPTGNVRFLDLEGRGDDDDDDDDNSSGTSDYDFQDALDHPVAAAPSEHAITSAAVTASRKKSIAEFKLTDSHQVATGKVFSRCVVRVSGVKLFASLSGPLDVNCPAVDPLQLSHRRFVEICNGSPVYSVVEESKTHFMSAQSWCQLSVESADVLAVCDVVDGKVRILITESVQPSTVHLKISIAHFYLLLSTVVDNGCEEVAFVSHSNVPSTQSRTRMHIRNILQHNHMPHVNRFKGVYPEYGTPDYVEYIRGSLNVIELVLVRSAVQVECTMQNDCFAADIPSMVHIARVSGDISCSDDVPFASISLKWVSATCNLGTDIRQVAIGVGDVVIADMRDPNCVREVVSMSLPRESLFHGYGDLDYGLKHLISELCCGESLDIPLKFSFFSVGNSWRTVNCGLAYLNIDLSDFGMIMLLYDYFSLYFRNKEYGNPVLAAHTRIDESDWPYGGFDARVFLFKPHLQISEKLKVGHNSHCIVVEAGSGAFVRFVVDSNRSVRTELRGHDIAVVMLHAYKTPAASRGIRGTAGSGRGVRSLVEYMTFEFSYHVNQPSDQVDILFSFAPAERNDKIFELMDMKRRVNDRNDSTRAKWKRSDLKSKSAYIDFDSESLSIPGVTVRTPKCNVEVVIPPRQFPRECCSIVSSYEDMALAAGLISAFFSVPFSSLKGRTEVGHSVKVSKQETS
jgi:hypothetical protein